MTTETSHSLDGASLDVAADNRARLRALFPSCFSETRDEKGNLVESVDFERLKAELGTFTNLFEARRERYGMDWPGKKDALKLIQTPTYATLKPAKDQSVDWESTENVFIEGDNLETLKLLQKSYYGKVKMIYIDPPYNTGKEFIYPDNYSESLETYLAFAGLLNEDGRKFEANTPNEGRFHTKWLNMMYPRLYLARNLLSDDGVIFISIGEDEVSNLRKLCDELLGEENFLGMVTWKARVKPVNIGEAKYRPQREIEYVLIYQKQFVEKTFLPLLTGGVRSYPKELDGRKYRLTTILKSNRGANYRSTMSFELNGYAPPEGQRWQAGEDVMNQLWSDGYIEFVDGVPFRRYFEDEEGAEHDPFYCFMEVDWSSTSEAGKNQLNEILGNDHGFDTVKPVRLIETLIQSCVPTTGKGIILDFFAGSGTTAHAVMTLNAKDGGDRKFICVQLPEPAGQNSTFANVVEIGKERIRVVVTKQKEAEERENDQDLGFRVLKLDKSNFRRWQKLGADATADQIAEQLELHVEHVDPSASQEDLLFEILLKAGFRPTEKAELVEIAGLPVYSIADGALLICLADRVTKELVDAVAETEPMHFFCLDSAFGGNDQLKANAVQTFAARNQGREKASQIVFRTV